MLNKHVYSLIACCTLAAALIFSAFTPPNNLESKVKSPTKTLSQTDPIPVECGCTFSSGSCADCTCVGGFATGCASVTSMRDGGVPAPLDLTMSPKQLRQALKYQRFLLSLDSPDAIAAASQVSQLIEALQDGKAADYQRVSEQYLKTFNHLPKVEKDIVCIWVDNKKKIVEKMPEQPIETVETPDKN
jgi:hypothetical protein